MKKFANNKSLILALTATMLFLLVNTFLLSKDFFLLSLVPAILLGILLFIFKMETGLMVMALLTPLAVDMELVGNMRLSMPVEPLMIGFTLLFIFRVLVSRSYDKKLLRHPVSIVIIAQLIWMLITACFSQLPAVSFKYFAARLWFVIPFYFAAVQIFKNQTRIRQYFWCYVIGMVYVILYATFNTFQNTGDLQVLHRVMKPFYNDHTAYGCVLALFVPAAFYLVSSSRNKGWTKLLGWGVFGLIILGLGLSYSRAAWLSVMGAIGVYVLIRMGVKIKWMALLFGCCVGAFFYYQSDLMYKLGKNKQDSSLDLAGQIQSISNISTDASNLERLNRWASAFRLFKEHPYTGCGPGTYQFLYGSYQRSYQKSVISTDFGNLGNAHSEYIGPLTEQGVVGCLLVLCVFMTTFVTGVKVYRTASDPLVGRLALAFTLSLLTYYIHGVFNNFLDTDKLSVPFWGFTAIVVALDVYSQKRNTTLQERNNNTDIHESL